MAFGVAIGIGVSALSTYLSTFDPLLRISTTTIFLLIDLNSLCKIKANNELFVKILIILKVQILLIRINIQNKFVAIIIFDIEECEGWILLNEFIKNCDSGLEMLQKKSEINVSKNTIYENEHNDNK